MRTPSVSPLPDQDASQQYAYPVIASCSSHTDSAYIYACKHRHDARDNACA